MSRRTALASASWWSKEPVQASELVLALALARVGVLVLFCRMQQARQPSLMQAITYSFGQILQG